MLYNLIIFIIIIGSIYYFYSNLETFNTDADLQNDVVEDVGYNLHKKYSEIIADKNIPWNIRRSRLLEIEKKTWQSSTRRAPARQIPTTGAGDARV